MSLVGELGGDRLRDGAAKAARNDRGVGDVEAAVRAELESMAVDPARDARAATALEMARQLDDPDNSATSKSMCAGRIQEALDRLLELHPPQQEDTPLDRIKGDRVLRIAAATA